MKPKKSKQVKLLTGAAKAKWLATKVKDIKHITDNFGHHTSTYMDAMAKFKKQKGVVFEYAEDEIKRLYKYYFSEKSSKQK